MARCVAVDFESADPATAARALLGTHLVRILDGKVRRTRIVETEAYWEEDPASHSFAGLTPRTRVMFGPPGRAYVYRIHRVVCLNVVVGREGRGQAVLIRAVEPILGIEDMQRARSRQTVGKRTPQGVELTNGPGKLCQALDVTMAWYGADLILGPGDRNGLALRESRSGAGAGPGLEMDPQARSGNLFLQSPPTGGSFEISCSPRIGVSKAKDEPMRFFIKGNRWVSPRKSNQ